MSTEYKWIGILYIFGHHFSDEVMKQTRGELQVVVSLQSPVHTSCCCFLLLSQKFLTTGSSSSFSSSSSFFIFILSEPLLLLSEYKLFWNTFWPSVCSIRYFASFKGQRADGGGACPHHMLRSDLRSAALNQDRSPSRSLLASTATQSLRAHVFRMRSQLFGWAGLRRARSPSCPSFSAPRPPPTSSSSSSRTTLKQRVQKNKYRASLARRVCWAEQLN